MSSGDRRRPVLHDGRKVPKLFPTRDSACKIAENSNLKKCVILNIIVERALTVGIQFRIYIPKEKEISGT